MYARPPSAGVHEPVVAKPPLYFVLHRAHKAFFCLLVYLVLSAAACALAQLLHGLCSPLHPNAALASSLCLVRRMYGTDSSSSRSLSNPYFAFFFVRRAAANLLSSFSLSFRLFRMCLFACFACFFCVVVFVVSCFLLLLFVLLFFLMQGFQPGLRVVPVL